MSIKEQEHTLVTWDVMSVLKSSRDELAETIDGLTSDGALTNWGHASYAAHIFTIATAAKVLFDNGDKK